jgi:hypothetical protein
LSELFSSRTKLSSLNKGACIDDLNRPNTRVRDEIFFKQPSFFSSRHSVDRLESSADACEQRDGKGFSANSRPEIIKELTGISDRSERRTDAEGVIDTTKFTPQGLHRESTYI